MKIIQNSGTERVADILRPSITPGGRLDIVSPAFSLFAFAEMLNDVAGLDHVRLILPSADHDLSLLGAEHDRPFRNRLQARWFAKRCLDWISGRVEIRRAAGAVPQGALIARNGAGETLTGLMGSLAFSTSGLGITPGNPMSLIQCAETPPERQMLAAWFDQQLRAPSAISAVDADIGSALKAIANPVPPMMMYALILHHLFASRGEALDEESIVKTATGIRDTKVWRKLFKFQRDGVIGAIDKLNRFGGCIIADSVGLGKTFEALAIIKYYELRNDRCLVLCPKRLRDNWTIYKANDIRNVLSADRLHYDVLNHTDLSRDTGASGDINLRTARFNILCFS